MGTRGLLGFIIKNKLYGYYNHHDSYPEHLGVKIVQFILRLKEDDFAKMVDRLEKLTWVNRHDDISDEDFEYYFSREFHLRDDIGDRYEKRSFNTPFMCDWFNLLYASHGALCLPQILDGSLKHLTDDTGFEDDWLFCEYVYRLDFEERTLEMEGHQWDGEGMQRWDFDELAESQFWKPILKEREKRDREFEARRAKFLAKKERGFQIFKEAILTVPKDRLPRYISALEHGRDQHWQYEYFESLRTEMADIIRKHLSGERLIESNANASPHTGSDSVEEDSIFDVQQDESASLVASTSFDKVAQIINGMRDSKAQIVWEDFTSEEEEAA